MTEYMIQEARRRLRSSLGLIGLMFGISAGATFMEIATEPASALLDHAGVIFALLVNVAAWGGWWSVRRRALRDLDRLEMKSVQIVRDMN